MASQAANVQLEQSRFQSPLGNNEWHLIGIAFKWKSSSPPPRCIDAQGNALFKLMESVSHTVVFGLAVLVFTASAQRTKASIFSMVFLVCVQALMTTVSLKQSHKDVRFEKALVVMVDQLHTIMKSRKNLGSRLIIVSQWIQMKRA